jgi:hypothetical protein
MPIRELLLPNRLDSGGLKAAVAGYERKAKMEGSCSDDAVGHEERCLAAGVLWDTPPQKRCCTATLVAVGKPSGNQQLKESRALWSAAWLL